MLQSSSSSLLKYQHRALSCFLVIWLFSAQIQQSNALIVPNELPSILSLIYSNIPPIKKGTDSRLGFGFRLGEHADFQVLLELGPQKETRPIGNPDDAEGSSFNKRQVNKLQQLRVQQETTSTEKNAASWLEKWSNDASSSMAKSKIVKKQVANKPAKMPVMPQLPDQSLKQLQMLYKMASISISETTLPSAASSTVARPIDAAAHLQERLKIFKPPVSVDELQNLPQRSAEKTKAEITKELMDVNLDR